MILFKKNVLKVSKRNQVSKISNGNIMVKSRQRFPNRGGVQKIQKFPKFKHFPSKGGGGLRTWEQFPSYTL